MARPLAISDKNVILLDAKVSFALPRLEEAVSDVEPSTPTGAFLQCLINGPHDQGTQRGVDSIVIPFSWRGRVQADKLRPDYRVAVNEKDSYAE